MNSYLTIKELRERAGIKFVSSDDVLKIPTGKSYKTLENENESKTHDYMRNYGIEYFKRLDYQIYPEGIGIEGIYTFVDFLAFKDDRIVFVECLMDNNITDETICRKSQLSAFGELCFVVVGGSGYNDPWVNDYHDIPQIMKDISKQTSVLTFYYGHWKNDFEKKISTMALNFPRVSFDIKRNEPIRVKVLFDTKRKTCNLYLSFLSKAYLNEDEQNYMNEILRLFCLTLSRKKIGVHFSGRWNLNSKSGIKYKDENSEIVGSVKIASSTGILQVKGRLGLEVIKELLNYLKQLNLQTDYDENDFENLKNKFTSSSSPAPN